MNKGQLFDSAECNVIKHAEKRNLFFYSKLQNCCVIKKKNVLNFFLHFKKRLIEEENVSTSIYLIIFKT